jgi:hypothetical protein
MAVMFLLQESGIVDTRRSAMFVAELQKLNFTRQLPYLVVQLRA